MSKIDNSKQIASVGIMVLMMLLSVVVEAQEEYAYAVRGNDTLKMDVYLPVSSREDSSCIIYLHGGAFRSGAKRHPFDSNYCALLASRGFVAVSVEYRQLFAGLTTDSLNLCNLIPTFDTVLQAAVEDCAAAIAYVAEQAERWSISKRHLYLVGSSAGAITILQTDYCRANGIGWASMIPADLNLAGIISYSGAVFSRQGKVRYQQLPTPTCLFHGTRDRIVPYKGISFFRNRFEGSRRLVRKLKKADANYLIYRIEDLAHDVCEFGPMTIEELEYFIAMTQSGRHFQYDTESYGVQPLPILEYYKPIWRLN